MSFASFTSRGAAITSFKAPNGEETSLKYANIKNYEHDLNRFFGASVGRVANRIYGSKVTIAGKDYPLAVTVPANGTIPDVTLHGGIEGWDKKFWEGPSTVKRPDGKESQVFTLKSDHLDQGFPGSVIAKAIYTAYTDKDNKNVLELEYEVVLTDDAPVDETVVSVTNHNFFNITGGIEDTEKTITGTVVKVNSNQYIVHDPVTSAPTGEIADFPGIPKSLEFTAGPEGPAIDHAFVVQPADKFTKLDTRDKPLVTLVSFYHPDSKIHLDVKSTEPVYQIYTTDGMNQPKFPGEKRSFPGRSAIAVEPARYTNASDFEPWKQWVTLKKGDVYGSKIVYVTWND